MENTMKHPVKFVVAAAAAAGALLLGSCSSAPQDADVVTLQVAAHAPPMTDVVLAAAESIEEGYEIEMVEVADYVQPNMMLSNGEIDANFVQHESFMEEFNEANGASLVLVQTVYETVVAFYSRELASLDELTDGASIAIPSDRANMGRALELLQAEGIITIEAGVAPFAADVKDIAENPRNLDITTIDLMNLNAAYEEVDAIFHLPSFVRQIGLTPDEDGIAVERDARFAVGLVTRAEDADSEMTEVLKRAFTTDAVRAVLEESGNPVAF